VDLFDGLGLMASSTPTGEDDWHIRMPKAAQLVADKVREQIIRAEYSPGDLLPGEQEMLRRMGISRPTLREAYRVLESEGLITVTRGINGGARVQQPTSVATARYTGMLLQHLGTTLEELCVARAWIQVPAAGVLAEERNPEHIATLKALLDEDPAKSDPERAVQALTSFHSAVVRLVGNRAVIVLSDIVEQIFYAGTRRLVRHQAEHGMLDSLDASHASHQRLIDLIESGDAAAAQEYWGRHLMTAGRMLTGDQGPDSPIDVLN
jgi:GntR family transcriptional regulator, transcriptional repressor for pyruvate dehydrogenase complex